jgi:hypothetical protein
MWNLFLAAAVAQEAPETTSITVAITPDLTILVGDRPIEVAGLADALTTAKSGGATEVLLMADASVAYGDVMAVISAINDAGLQVSQVVDTADRPPDPLFPGAGAEVTELGTGLTKAQIEAIEPRRYKFPQNPYATTDFTAYTLEWGETRVGLASVSYGLLPRTQIGTIPLLDAIGAYNLQGKVNLMRFGPLDGAIDAQAYTFKVTDLMEKLDGGRWGISPQTIDTGQQLLVADFTYLGLGYTSSLQIAGGWSLHGGVGYSRVTGDGTLDLQALPGLIAPGFDPEGDQPMIVADVTGEIVEARLATDYRFNRRDSLIVQAVAPVYARVRGTVTGVEEEDLPAQLQGGGELMVGEGQWLPVDKTYRASLSYQVSWKRVDARLGIGVAGKSLPYSWIEQSFDLAYRLGGRTRHTESKIERGFRRNTRDLRKGGDTRER